MSGKFIKTFLILLALLVIAGGVFFVVRGNVEYTVLKIEDGDSIYIDFNNNGVAEYEEKKGLSDIDAFETKSNRRLSRQARDYGLSEQEALELGYLAKELLKKKVLNKKVKVKFTDKRKRYALIYLNGELVQDELIESGLAVPYKRSGRYEDNSQQVKEARKLLQSRELVILNLKNNKYHKPGCKYGVETRDYELVERKNLPESGSTCGFCHGNKEFRSKPKPVKKNEIINLNVPNGGSVEFINIRARDYKKPSETTRTEAGQRLIELINNARNNIYFFSYGLSKQPQIIASLESAHNRGVKVKGLVH